MKSSRKLGLVVLEDRLVPSGSPLAPATAEQTSPLVTALTTQRSWIAYSPTSSDGSYNANPSDATITSDLQTLYDEGWRGLQTYTMLGTYSHIPKIAKQVGFEYVIAGIYNLTGADAAPEMANATNPAYVYINGMDASGGYAIDGFMVGNEGLAAGRYTYANLIAAMNQVASAAATSTLPMTTSEPASQYLSPAPNATQLLQLGDWIFPNLDYFCWANQLEGAAAMWDNVAYGYNAVKSAAQAVNSPLITIVHESWYATSGDGVNTPPLTSQANQVSYYSLMVSGQNATFPISGDFYFVWGEAYNQPWKAAAIPCCDAPTNLQQPEPYYGLHGDDSSTTTNQREAKQIITSLQSDYTGTYPIATPAANPQADYVEDLYRSVLGRDGSQTEVDAWTSVLQGGAATTSVANSFLKSIEYRGLQVDQLYLTLLNRPSDSVSRAIWVNRLEAGLSLDELCVNFVTSPEYFALAGSASAFIDELYIDLLDRPADAAGKSAWLAAMGSDALPSEIARAFLRSAEGAAGLVDAFYLHYLRRAADVASRSAFAGQLQSGDKTSEQLILDFLASNEYYAN